MVGVWREARRGRLQFLLDLHDADEDAKHLREVILPRNAVWVVGSGQSIVGFIAFADGWVNQLYVSPGWQRGGLGARLLSLAKREFRSVQLWVFEENDPAIRFYESQGFRVVERTDGRANEARRPDLRLEWHADVDAPARTD